MNLPQYSTLVEIAQSRAHEQAQKTAYTFIASDDTVSSYTYQDIDRRARAIASRLTQMNLKGERALLLYLPGLDYVEAFWGCLYAGVVAVPAYPPDPKRLGRTLPRLQGIIEDSNSALIMTTSGIENLAKDLFADANWLSTDLISNDEAASWKMPHIDRNSLAFLQYTSGSTSKPRGVMLTHRNIFSNLQLVESSLPLGKNPKICSWLPPYHDMGLIGGILQPLHSAIPAVLMSPLDFLGNPFKWLKTISDYRATASAGPNFAYDLCVKRISEEQRNILDLSSWNIAVNGAEPVRLETLTRFCEYFEPCGFRPEAFFPSYGLAESTVYVSGGSNLGFPPSIENKTLNRTFVGCGKKGDNQEILIVNPETCDPVHSDEVGEIWVKHPSISNGYWGKPEQSAYTFQAQLSNGEGPYLRTGDLGFMNDGELYVTGRQKDLIIIRGRNHYPQDIEQTFEVSHPSVRPGCVAAFSLEQNGQEQVGIVAEVSGQDFPEIIKAIQNSVLANHDLRVDVIALIEAKSIPKTSSGKIQRHACRDMLLNETLDLVHLWRTNSGHTNIQSHVAAVLGIDSLTNLNLDEPLVQFGLDSLMRQELIASLEKLVGRDLKDLKIDETTTLRSLSSSLGNISPTETAKSVTPENNFETFSEVVALQQQIQTLKLAGLQNPFFTEHESLVRDTTQIHGENLINFSNYNYIGMAGDERVSKAAKDAIDQYGTSVSASRLVSGERPLHHQLEQDIARFIGVEDSIVYVSGYGTNVTFIGHLFGPGDLIVHDSLSHNSILTGCKLSGAKAMPFPHNDAKALERILAQHRPYYKRCVVIIEGIYSMDGDIPDLAQMVEVKKRHQAFLMVDEAHSAGTLGKTGRGLAEYADVAPTEVDFWMGTLSKSFAGCGGYIAGTRSLAEYLRYSSPGFVYSVGISPPNAAASLAAIEILKKEPHRVEKLQYNSKLFLSLAKEKGLNTGMSASSPIIPIIIGDSMKTLVIAENLLKNSINVRPIIYPAVEDHLSRLRFFITSCHSEEQIRQTVDVLQHEVTKCMSL